MKLNKFDEIKSQYDYRLPYWMDHFEKTGMMNQDPYFRDWIVEFTPIERYVWSDLRGNGLDFFPQFPACGFFLDFANPFLKIAIECDGQAYHDKEKDFQRDMKLQNDGWIVFRVTGSECNRNLPTPLDKSSFDEYGPTREQIYNYYNTTSEGVVTCIKAVFFNRTGKALHERYEDDYIREIYISLDDHCNTKQTLIKALESNDL